MRVRLAGKAGQDRGRRDCGPPWLTFCGSTHGSMSPLHRGIRAQGPGFSVQRPGYRFKGSRFRAHGSGFTVQSSGYRVKISRAQESRLQGSWPRVCSPEFKVLGTGSRNE